MVHVLFNSHEECSLLMSRAANKGEISFKIFQESTFNCLIIKDIEAGMCESEVAYLFCID